jgi:EmrB/QacA subfamily drug resistance transporter
MSNPAVSTTTQRMTLLATGLGLFMIFLDASIVNVALPDIQNEFNVGEQGLQWVVAAYSLTMGMFIMSAATLSDTGGRRKAYVAGVVVFCAASIACGLAPDLAVLNVARGFQGVGAAIVNVSSLALVSAAFPEPAAKARAIGLWTGIASVGFAIGPTLGGALTESVGWRSIFLVNAAVGALTVGLTYLFVVESKDPGKRSLDLPGQLLFILGIGALTYALIEGPQLGWLSPAILSLLLGAAVCGALFARVELRSRDPMLDVRLFRDPVYSVALVTIFAVMFCIYGAMLVVTQYFQNVQGFSAEKAGALMMAMTVPIVILAPLAGGLAARFGGRLPTLAGMSCLVAALVVLAAGLGGWFGLVPIGLTLLGIASGLTVAPTTSVAMSSAPPERAGMASGIMSAQRAVGSTVGFAIMGSALALVVSSELPAKFEPFISNASERKAAVEQVVERANPRAVVALIGPGRPLPDEIREAPELLAAADAAFVSGMRAALGVGILVALGALIAGFIVFPRGRRAETVQEAGEASALEREEQDRKRDAD